MLIRKLFKFENAHIVRNCTSDRCRRSIHGHSYQVDLILEAHRLDHGQMVYDFGLLKGVIRDLIDSFDHAICYWNQDDPAYIAACQQFSARWISLPVSPSAEQFSRIFFFLADAVLRQPVEAFLVHAAVAAGGAHDDAVTVASLSRPVVDDRRAIVGLAPLCE